MRWINWYKKNTQLFFKKNYIVAYYKLQLFWKALEINYKNM